MKILELVVKMFNAYNEDGPHPWKTFDGRPVPRWEDLNDSVRSKWRAAKRAASESDDVLEFMRKFGQVFKRGDGTELEHAPRMLTRRKLFERFDFLNEEVTEFGLAIAEQNMEELADALVDLVYVAKGTANLMGLPWDELWADVHRANMEKVRGVGSRGNLVDCIKPPGWKPPNTEAILKAAGWNELPLSQQFVQWDDPEYCPGGPQTVLSPYEQKPFDVAARESGLTERQIDELHGRHDPEKAAGLNGKKFVVTRTDGSSGKGGKHEACEFFVLDLEHDQFAKAALLAYARACAQHYPKLAKDLRAKAVRLGAPS